MTTTALVPNPYTTPGFALCACRLVDGMTYTSEEQVRDLGHATERVREIRMATVGHVFATVEDPTGRVIAEYNDGEWTVN